MGSTTGVNREAVRLSNNEAAQTGLSTSPLFSLPANPTAEEKRAFGARVRALRAKDVRELSDEELDALYCTAGRYFWNIPTVLTLERLRRSNAHARRTRDVSEADGYVLFVCSTTASGTQWTFRCPWCRTKHFHGAIYGPRVAHCHDRRSPYYSGGQYYIAHERDDADFIEAVRLRGRATVHAHARRSGSRKR